MLDLDALKTALAPTRDGLDASGFDLGLAEQNGQLVLTVIPRENACEDCLVPKSLFKQMARDEIVDAGLAPVELDVLYPVDSRRKNN
jgi:hypothetical protein